MLRGTHARLSLMKSCRTPGELHEWVKKGLLMNVPRKGVCAGHAGPFEYLKRAYFEPGEDLVVWAPRGGGKTRLGAAATLLDLLHKPGCEVRILGGSLEQSLKMWEHLWPDVTRFVEGQVVSGDAAGKRVRLKNGSGVAVLTQSERAVRGLRVQKLRCDEVELFEPEVWDAAQLVTRTKEGSGVGVQGSGKEEGEAVPISGAVEALSTLHAPFGLMQRVVEKAELHGKPVIRWCILEVLEKCPKERVCSACPLWEECRGVAKEHCDGFMKIDDAIAMKRRVSKETWESEMLCQRPSVKDCVFPTFDVALHVTESVDNADEEDRLWLGVDFGFKAPFVCLFIREDRFGVTSVVDEYVQEKQTMDEHVGRVKARWGTRPTIACDPAGGTRNEQTAVSNIALLRKEGFRVVKRKSAIIDGLEEIRTALKRGDGEINLFIHPRCKRLIAALRGFRYQGGGGELPWKDGVHDHLIDALRYYFVNRKRGEVVTRVY